MLCLTLLNKHPMTLKQTHLKQRFLFSACILYLLFITSPVVAEKDYIKCWKNAQGLTECGNRVPRQFYNQRIRYVDDKGVTRKVKERALTQEERDAENELQKLQAQEAEQRRKAKEYDLVLLKTYLTIDDLLASLNSKLSIINSRSKIQESGLELKKREFGNLVRQAADMERSGKQISEKLAKKLDKVRTELRNLQTQLSIEEQRTREIKSTFAHDVERFMIAKSHRIKHSLSTPSLAKKLRAVKFSCLSRIQCDASRQKANSFIKEFSTRDILYQTPRITVTDIPVAYQDIAMGLTILDTEESKDTKLMILQIRCNREREGQEFCNSDVVNDLLKEFRTMIYK